MPLISVLVGAELLEQIRALKGAPLGVFLLLNLATTPVSQGWLEKMSGYSDKPVREALKFLRGIGWAVKTSIGWRLADRAQPLPGQDSPDEPEPDDDGMLMRKNSGSVDDPDDYDDAPVRKKSGSMVDDDEILMRNFSGFGENRVCGQGSVVDDRRLSRKNSDSSRNFSGKAPDSTNRVLC